MKYQTKGHLIFHAGLLAMVGADPAAATADIEEIIVTAQKRPELVQEVPVSIQVLSGGDIEALGITRADDILSHFANVSINASNEVNSGFTIRGVGTSNFHGNVARAIGVYLDEVSVSTPFSGTMGLFDMERIEVLRGPQNTLFGRNTTGGAINYISKKPAVEAGANSYALASYGSHDTVRAEAALNLPVSDNAAFRLAGTYSSRDGLFTNRLNGTRLGDKESHAFRAQFLWRATDDTEILVNYHRADHSGTNKGIKANGVGDSTDPSQPCTDDIGDFSRQTDCAVITGFNPSGEDFHSVYLAVSPRQDIETEGGFIRLGHSFGSGMELTSITAVEQAHVRLSEDNAGANVLIFNPMQDADYGQFTQEIRLLSPADEPFRWLIGGLYLEEGLMQATVVRRDANAAAPPGPGPNAEVISYNLLDQKDRDLSVYGQMEYDLTPDLTVTLGLRYTDNRKTARSDFGVLVSPTALFDPLTFIDKPTIDTLIANGASDPRIAAVAVPNFTLLPEQDLSELTGKLGLDYRISEQAMVYASYSRGFKSGGFDTRALAALNGDAGTPVGAEYLDAYEIGLKSNPSTALRLNISAFYYGWEDAQIFAVSGGIPAFTNIPSARVLGLDAEMEWVPTPDWSVKTAIGLLDSEITDSGNLVGVTEEHDLSNAPGFSASAQISRQLVVGPADVLLSANARYVGERYEGVDASRDFASTKEPIFELNLRADVSFGENSPFSMALWADNVTGEQYCIEKRLLDRATSGAVPGLISGAVNCTPSDGRATWGITGKMVF